MPLVERVLRTIRAHELAGGDTRIVVALSGGSDSVALAHLLGELAGRGLVRLAGIAHLNHQLRPAADADEAFCAAVAGRLGLPFIARREDVSRLARESRRSIEDAARTARYALLADARRELGGDVVALGHTRDDQAETFLLRLIRGAGARGLAGMHPRHGVIIRPLFECRRSELRAYLDQHNIAFVHDESNDDVSIPRNRVRAELLPLLERRFNPSIVHVLADEASIARAEWSWIHGEARRAAATIVAHPAPHVWTIDTAGLAAEPVALQRAVVHETLVAAAAGVAVAFRHVEDALQAARPDAGAVAIDGPGLRMERVGGSLVLTSRAGRPRGSAPPNLFRYPLSIPGEVALAEAGYVVSAETAAEAPSAIPSSSAAAVLQLDRCRAPLTVRNRRPGDRFRPLGLDGRKKLQDFLVDKKVPRGERDRVPLVVDEDDRIVWVAGHGIDHEFRVTDPAQAVLILRLRQV